MAAYRQVYDMRVCRCGPDGRWWQPTTGFMTMHAVTCRLTASSPGSAPAPYARLRVWAIFTFLVTAMSMHDHV